MLKHRSVFIFFLLLYSFKSLALPVDSLSDIKKYKTSIKYFYEKDFIYGKTNRYNLDTSISSIHTVHPALDLHNNFLGTPGSASNPQIFRIDFNTYTFTSIRSYDLQMMISDSLKSFNTNKRFTELRYSNGGFKEQQIAVVHSQNINKNWNAGINFDRQGVKDFMNYSNTFRSRFAIYTWYRTPDKKYNLFAHAIWNSIKNGVNGGLASDSLFDNTVVTNLGIKGLAYRISNAEQNVRKKIFLLSQYYDLGKSIEDSSGNIIRRKPPIRLHHLISVERKSFVYKDPSPDSSFYYNFYHGAITYDSLHSEEITNRFSVQLPADTIYRSAFSRYLSTGIFAEYRHVNYGQVTDSSWNNLAIGGNIFLKSDSSLPEVFLEGTYVIEGIDKTNYLVELKAFSPEYKLGKIGINLTSGQSSPDLIYRWYDGNNFFWKNSFDPILNQKAGVNYSLAKFHLSIQANYLRIDNFVYMNSNAFPEQFNGVLSIKQINIYKKFNYRHWHLKNDFTLQKSDEENVLHLPSFVSDQSLYFEKSYYKKALLAAIGVTLNYNSSYYADAFMPATGMFYLQSATKTGGYFRFDLFINAQIKTARFFLKFENIADDLIKRSYYLTPHYPMPGRVLKFGVVWRFFDQ